MVLSESLTLLMRLRPAPDSKKSPKISNFGPDGSIDHKFHADDNSTLKLQI
jgi:hypothetical protein